MKHMPIHLKLFLVFFKIGLFTFGGGYAMIPLIHRETVEGNQWIDDETIGHRVAGFWGALCATLGVTLPSFLVISILSLFIMQYKKIKWLAWIFDGIRAGVVVLIVNAVLKLGKQCPRTNFAAVIILLAFLGSAFFGVDVIILLICAAISGIIRQMVLAHRYGGKEDEA